MRIAICDDEKNIRELIGNRVHKLYPEAELVFYETGEALLAEENQPDILFLDIQMPGIDGMEAARTLRKKGKDTILIFVTGIEEYVFQAFDVWAFHFKTVEGVYGEIRSVRHDMAVKVGESWVSEAFIQRQQALS